MMLGRRSSRLVRAKPCRDEGLIGLHRDGKRLPATGRTIAMTLPDRARGSAGLVTLNAAPISFAFWEALGFERNRGRGCAHIRQ